jgi:hypothetical protein
MPSFATKVAHPFRKDVYLAILAVAFISSNKRFEYLVTLLIICQSLPA